jgi:protocatechuate 3,4-dioxygenase beta subunit
MWQVDSNGKYPYQTLRGHTSKKLANTKSTFLGSGTAVTNNLGEFAFITIYPVSKINYVNLRVEAGESVKSLESNRVQTLQTRIYLRKPSKILYNDDADYKDNEYYFDVVVPRTNANNQ